MPKKKNSKTIKKSTRSAAPHVDDYSFLIIVGGGFIVLIALFVVLGGLNLKQSFRAQSAQVEKIQVVDDMTVTIKDFAFGPSSLTVKAGTEVTWMNSDEVSHSATADDGTFDTKLLATGETGSYTFSKPGTYTYHCSVHPSMIGTIIVE